MFALSSTANGRLNDSKPIAAAALNLLFMKKSIDNNNSTVNKKASPTIIILFYPVTREKLRSPGEGHDLAAIFLVTGKACQLRRRTS